MASHTSISCTWRAQEQRLFMELPGAAPLIMTYGPGEVPEGGTAKKFLAASAMLCFCAALNAALTARGCEFSNIRGTATVETGANAVGKSTVASLFLDVHVDLPEEYEDTFERVGKVLASGCLITASLASAMRVSHTLTPHYA